MANIQKNNALCNTKIFLLHINQYQPLDRCNIIVAVAGSMEFGHIQAKS